MGHKYAFCVFDQASSSRASMRLSKRQAAAPPPGKRPRHPPAAGKNGESPDSLGFCDDLNEIRPAPPGQGRAQIGAAVAALCQPRRARRRLAQALCASVRSLARSGMVAPCPARTSSAPSGSPVRERLRPVSRLPAASPAGPPLSVVFTLWLSLPAAGGRIARPDRHRTRNAASIRSRTPPTLRAHASKED